MFFENRSLYLESVKTLTYENKLRIRFYENNFMLRWWTLHRCQGNLKGNEKYMLEHENGNIRKHKSNQPFSQAVNQIPLHSFQRNYALKAPAVDGSFERRANLFMNSDGIITSCTTYDSFPFAKRIHIFRHKCSSRNHLPKSFLERNWYSERWICSVYILLSSNICLCSPHSSPVTHLRDTLNPFCSRSLCN